MRSYSQDLRDRVIGLDDGKNTFRDIAKRLGVGKTFVASCLNRFRLEKVSTSKRQGGYKVSKLSEHRSAIKAWIREDKNITIDDMVSKAKEELGIKIGRMTIWDWLDKNKLTFKKNSARQRARQARRTSKA